MIGLLRNVFKKKDEPIKNYGDFWAWFKKNEKTFFRVIERQDNIERDFFDKISPKLLELKDGFYYLTGMYDDNTAELILTPEGNIANIVFVEELVASAPHMPGWKFTALKPALEIENVKITMDGYIFGSETLSFYAKEHTNYPDEIDIVIVHKDFNEEDKVTITNGVYIFLDNFLGELNSVTTIDSMTVVCKADAEKELIPIEKMKDFLVWREAEFLEKYEGESRDKEKDSYSGVETQLKNGRALVAMINMTMLEWDRKASHPWFMTVKITYNGDDYNGMPDADTHKLMEDFQDEIMEDLKDHEGYLNIGRESGDNSREIYFACKEFRKPSKVLHEATKKYAGRLDVSYEIRKDKYWQAMERYR